MKDISMPKDIFTLEDDDSKKKKKKKKKKSSKNKKRLENLQTVFMYPDVVKAAMINDSMDENEIPRYIMRTSNYNIVEKDGECDVTKVKSIQLTVNEKSLSTINSQKFIRKRVNVKNNICITGVDYTVIRIKFTDYADILNFIIGLPTDRGSEIGKIFFNLSGVHDGDLLNKKKEIIGTIIR